MTIHKLILLFCVSIFLDGCFSSSNVKGYDSQHNLIGQDAQCEEMVRHFIAKKIVRNLILNTDSNLLKFDPLSLIINRDPQMHFEKIDCSFCRDGYEYFEYGWPGYVGSKNINGLMMEFSYRRQQVVPGTEGGIVAVSSDCTRLFMVGGAASLIPLDSILNSASYTSIELMGVANMRCRNLDPVGITVNSDGNEVTFFSPVMNAHYKWTLGRINGKFVEHLLRLE